MCAAVAVGDLIAYFVALIHPMEGIRIGGVDGFVVKS
jgi:hypothetical protein